MGNNPSPKDPGTPQREKIKITPTEPPREKPQTPNWEPTRTPAPKEK